MQRSSTYLNHTQNTSPAKTTYSFAKGQRFKNLQSHSPNKFYDSSFQTSKRATSLGFGTKTDFVNKNTKGPGLYELKSSFDVLNQRQRYNNSNTFGESHQNIFDRQTKRSETPGPGSYQPQLLKSKSSFYMGQRTNNPEESKYAVKISPQKYSIDRSLEKTSKFKNNNGFRIKSEVSCSRPEYLCPPIPGPGTYNLQKALSLKQILQQKSLMGGCTFGSGPRLKTIINQSNLGPGYYKIFSVFGEDQANYKL